MRSLLPALLAALCLIGCIPETEVCPNGGSSCETEVCSALTVTSRADIDAARGCGEIDGDLTLLGGATDITASDFPNLSKISGDLVISGFSNREPRLQRLTLGALKSVGGTLQIASVESLQTASFPALTTIGGPSGDGRLSVIFASLRRLDLPALTTINGSAELRNLGSLCSVNLRRVTRVTGSVDIDTVPNVPFSALSSLRNAAGGPSTVVTAGCCYFTDSLGCTDSSAFECTTTQCP